jgi:stage II sporulation protein D
MLSSTFLVSLSLLLGLPGTPAGPQAVRQTEPVPTFVVSGHGWGHAVGLSQYGALGYAQHGARYDAIIAHYFPGTTLGPAPLSKVRVLVAEKKKRVSISSKLPFVIKDAAGKRYLVPAGEYPFGPGLKVKVDPAKPARALPGPLVFSPGGTVLALDGRPYRGTLQVTVVDGRLQVVNYLGLELYLAGVVGREMPKDWPLEALKAQAVVARSYALSHLAVGGTFDLFSDTRSQVYGGVQAESPATTAAVNATAGRVVLYRGRVASTYFFSTSGGRTANVQDVWPSSQPLPYLVSVPDPYDSLSPYHDWGPLAFMPQFIARKLSVPGRVTDVQTIQNSSNRVRSVVVTSTLGQVTVTGTDARRALGLRSTWFRVGVLSLAAPATPLVNGAQARLSGVVRGLGKAVLQQRPYGLAWSSIGTVSPGADGTIGPVVQPRISTLYRLAVGKVTSAVARVSVAPLVRFYPVSDRTVLRGFVRPVLAGAPVQVQRLDGTTWTNVARASVDKNGDFTAQLTLTPGSYRARVMPGGGFVPGVSSPLKVVPA